MGRREMQRPFYFCLVLSQNVHAFTSVSDTGLLRICSIPSPCLLRAEVLLYGEDTEKTRF